MNTNRNIFIVFGLCCLLGVRSLAAQSGVVLEQRETTISDRVLMTQELTTLDQILAADIERLMETAAQMDPDYQSEKSTIFATMDGFRVDNQSPDGKSTVIYRKDSGNMYYIDWENHTFAKMSKEDVKQMRQKAANAMQQMMENMPEMEKMLANLPPEQREKALEAMKMMKSYGKDSESTQQKSKPKIVKTGKSKTIRGFSNCAEYRVVDGDKRAAIWAFSGDKDLAGLYHSLAKEFRETLNFGDTDEFEPESLLQNGNFPVLTLTLTPGLMDNPKLQISEILSAKHTELKPELFEAYKDPKLHEKSFMEMMH